MYADTHRGFSNLANRDVDVLCCCQLLSVYLTRGKNKIPFSTFVIFEVKTFFCDMDLFSGITSQVRLSITFNAFLLTHVWEL